MMGVVLLEPHTEPELSFREEIRRSINGAHWLDPFEVDVMNGLWSEARLDGQISTPLTVLANRLGFKDEPTLLSFIYKFSEKDSPDLVYREELEGTGKPYLFIRIGNFVNDRVFAAILVAESDIETIRM